MVTTTTLSGEVAPWRVISNGHTIGVFDHKTRAKQRAAKTPGAIVQGTRVPITTITER